MFELKKHHEYKAEEFTYDIIKLRRYVDYDESPTWYYGLTFDKMEPVESSNELDSGELERLYQKEHG
jgi:hypothetical protein